MFIIIPLLLIIVSIYLWRLRAILAIVIILTGGIITCGGNLFLANMGFGGEYGANLLIYWALEVGAIGIGAIYYMKAYYPKLDTKKLKQFYYILGTISGITIVSILLIMIFL